MTDNPLTDEELARRKKEAKREKATFARNCKLLARCGFSGNPGQLWQLGSIWINPNLYEFTCISDVVMHAYAMGQVRKQTEIHHALGLKA